MSDILAFDILGEVRGHSLTTRHLMNQIQQVIFKNENVLGDPT